jgi:FAD/FMN-containing dehydrogenase
MVRVEDASGFAGQVERVFTPSTPEETAAIVRQAVASRTPVAVAGAWTGVTGGAVPQSGWLISTAKLDRLEVTTGVAAAGAGVALRDLHTVAARSGQIYAPDPTESTASVGGTIATNASGSRSFLYGSTRRHVLALTVAMMDGSVRRFIRGQPVDFDVPAVRLPRTTKNTAGYPLRPGMDWVDLLTGSEGTLAVVCEAELQLLPAVNDLLTGVVFFPSDEAALGAVEAWRAVDGLRMLEYFDRVSIELLAARFPEVPAAARAALLFEQERPGESSVDAWVERLERAGADIEGSWFAGSPADRERFRVFRHALPEMVNDRMRTQGLMKLGSDYAVPVERNGAMMRRYHQRCGEEFPGRYVIFGHIGDAHVHVNLLPASGGEFERGRELMFELARHAVELGGTVSAEHGLGKRKAALLEIQYTREEIDAMKAVKRRLDPHWLLSPGTLFAA